MKAKEIRDLMSLRGWNQAELAAALDVEESTVSRWLRDLQNPTGPAKILIREWLAKARNEATREEQPA